MLDWRPISTAPLDATLIRVRLTNDKEFTAHFAEDLSGEEQPAFSGWFVSGGYKGGFKEVEAPPREWRTLTDAERQADDSVRRGEEVREAARKRGKPIER